MICKHILLIIFLNEPKLIFCVQLIGFKYCYRILTFIHLFAHSKINLHGMSVISFLNKLELICLHTNIAIVSTQLNGFNYCYLTLIILFNINHLFAHIKVVSSIAI